MMKYSSVPLTALLLVLLALLVPRPGRAQVPLDANPTVPKTVRPDTARARKPTAVDKRKKVAADSVCRTEKLFGTRVTRPAKAGYLALVSGLGQAYNCRWWKVPVVYASLGTTFGFLRFDQRAFKEYADAQNLLDQRKAQVGGAALGPRASQARSYDEVKDNVEYFRHYRDGLIFYTGIVYGLQVLDAIVDAHLHRFDVSDELALRWQPTLLLVPYPAAGLAAVSGIAVALYVKPPR